MVAVSKEDFHDTGNATGTPPLRRFPRRKRKTPEETPFRRDDYDDDVSFETISSEEDDSDDEDWNEDRSEP